jgi:signal transduction histidine kinase
MKKSLGWMKLYFIGVLIFCVVVVCTMVVAINNVSKTTINKVSTIYMNEMSTQLQNHFNSIIELRMDMVEGIIRHNPPESFTQYSEEMLEMLKDEAITRNFSFLGLYTTEGDIDVIYGSPIEIRGDEAFLNSLNQDDSKIARATDESGNQLLIMGISTSYPMEDGVTCTALIAGIDLQNIGYSMELMGDDSLCYAHIINKNGDFIIRTNKTEYITEDNYFDYLLQCNSQEPIEEIVDKAKESVENGEEYSATIISDIGNGDERRSVFFAPLSHSEWYLVCVMSRGTLDEVVQSQSYYRIGISSISVLAIMIMLLCYFLVYYRESTHQMKRLEQAQAAADSANMAKSRFLSNMSHDIRTPLNAVIGMTMIAKKNITDTDKVQYCLDKIMVSGKHLLGLINDILDMSKIESGKMTLNMTVVSIREVLDDIVTVIQSQVDEKKQNFDINISSIQSEWVYFDAVRLNQVFMNLISNALKFTPEGGTVDVTLTQEDSPKGEDYVRTNFWVKDTGIGMSQEFQKKVFESFAREDDLRIQKIEGSGLGTAITKHIVDMAQGTIEVKSELNKGTEFHVVLDMKRAQGINNDAAANGEHLQTENEGAVDFTGRRLLIAEDSEVNWEIANELLSDAGFTAEWAQGGQICVEKFSNSQPGYYDAILMDLRMPGMNGIDATVAIRSLEREDAKSVPIIAMTADAFEEDARRCLACGMNAHISKPLNMNKLLQLLRKYIK